ncbi:hypothetical protein C7212DRAFT_342466 [Tuber magnatum]|uniref:Tc1-like transposase DDE domain-containing protein n=1 Tax=Tuber magnatum TaxID=42249 RepID=A0A317SWC3_9PEZI|nr:hypothetical protein C7212DRAFT_342466 [Tuber magnatum]
MDPRCFAYSDQTWIEIGHPWHPPNISCPSGTNSYDYNTQQFKPTGIRIMFWMQDQNQTDSLLFCYSRQKRCPDWEIKEQIKERGDRSKEGIDWVLYRDQIERETGRKVWAVEDNASTYTIVKELGKEERKRLGIRSVDWPAQSPDLNKIEPLWAYLKDSLEEYEFTGQNLGNKL